MWTRKERGRCEASAFLYEVIGLRSIHWLRLKGCFGLCAVTKVVGDEGGNDAIFFS